MVLFPCLKGHSPSCLLLDTTGQVLSSPRLPVVAAAWGGGWAAILEATLTSQEERRKLSHLKIAIAALGILS